jgi:type VI secretion system secreted protein Hcp
MKKLTLLVTIGILLHAAAWAENGQNRGFNRRSSIVVTVDGLTCTTSAGTGMFPALTWSFGATQTTTTTGGGGTGAGRANITDVSVSKRTDSCSPILFGDVVSGRHVARVTIVQQDNNRDDVFTVVLEDVIVSSYQLGGSQNDEVPTEQISFNFGRITITDNISGNHFRWDLRLGRAF